jgi:Transposase DDE domain
MVLLASPDNHLGERIMLQRLARRVIGAVKAGITHLGLGRVDDPRSDQGRKWKLKRLLEPILTGMCADKHSLAEVETLTEDLARAARQQLGIFRRVPDTTMRDLLVKLAPICLVECLTRQAKRLHRQKALDPVGFPFGIAGIDGKSTCIDSWEHGLAQRQVGSDGQSRGLLRTMTCMLLSSLVPTCIHVAPIPPETNEDGFFRQLVDQLLDRFAAMDLFRLVMADAGSCSLGNADYARQKHLHYAFTLNEKQPTLLAEATRLLGRLSDEKKVAQSEERVGGGIERRTLFATTEMAGFHEWSHLETVLRVRRQQWNGEGQLELDHERYFLTSLRFKAMEPDQWLRLIRRYWGSVESGIHQTLDTVYEEDDRPWIRNDDKGALNLVILRRMAYNLVAQFRGRTQRSEDRRATPWRRVMIGFYQALICATQDVVSGLRPRVEAAGER